MAYVRTRKIVDDAGADAVIAAASAKAAEQGSSVVIAVVDPHGELIQMQRTPDAQIASSRVALDKARTAAIFVRPSREMEEQVTDGRLGALALHGASCLTGGIPLVVDGEVVGAVGTSGETPDEDEAISIAGAAAEFSVREVPALTYEGAKHVAEAVGRAAAERGVAPVVSAVDFEDQASNGRPSALHLARAVPLQGGVPIEHDGEVIGAVGVSGASSADEDRKLALIGAASLRPSSNGAVFFGSEAVQAGGGLLLDTSGYKLDAGRRTGPGEVEFHEGVVDVMHVVQGQATVVTGGEMVSPHEVAPGELRSDAVEGGTPHELSEGDVLAIPNGVPHQFTDVSDPFLYFVVKVEA